MKKAMTRIKDPAELIFLAVLFVVALYFFITAFRFSANDRIYPLFTSGATLIFIVSYALKLIKAAPENAERIEKTDEERAETRAEVKKIVVTVICFAGYIIVSYLVGFLISSALIALLYPLINGYRKPLGVISSFVVGIAIVLMFQKFLGIPLSRGVLLDLSPLFF